MVASGAIEARGSIPASGRYGGKKIASTRAKSAYGFALISVAHFASAASSAVVMAAETLDRNAGAYFALATKTIMPGPAASIGAGAKISTPPSPRSSSPSFDASSLSFMSMPLFFGSRKFSISSRRAHRGHRVGELPRFNLRQAVVVPEAAGARQAGAAFELGVNHARLRPPRPRANRIGRPENRDGRDSQRSRQMHTARIVADKPVAQRQQSDQFADVSVSGCDQRARFTRRRNFFALGTLRWRADQHDLGIFAARE